MFKLWVSFASRCWRLWFAECWSSREIIDSLASVKLQRKYKKHCKLEISRSNVLSQTKTLKQNSQAASKPISLNCSNNSPPHQPSQPTESHQKFKTPIKTHSVAHSNKNAKKTQTFQAVRIFFHWQNEAQLKRANCLISNDEKFLSTFVYLISLSLCSEFKLIFSSVTSCRQLHFEWFLFPYKLRLVERRGWMTVLGRRIN
jgi:hypothetical protein